MELEAFSGSVGLKALRARCEARLRGIELPAHFELQTFCQMVEARRGRPLLLHPVVSTLGPCGLWVAAPAADHIFYEQDTTPLHQLHIILHEISHVLCEHRPAPISGRDLPRMLFPDLEPALLQKVLERAGYSSEEEQEAEFLASLILEKTRRRPSTRGPVSSTPTARLVGKLEVYLAGRATERG